RLPMQDWLHAAGTPSFGYLGAVWGSSEDDVWVAGSGFLHKVGEQWSDAGQAPVDGLIVQQLWGTAANDIWGVAGAGRIIHYDGKSRSRVATPTTRWLPGLWGASPSVVWAVGRAGTILHSYAARWRPVASGTPNALSGVSGAPRAVWAVGTGGGILPLMRLHG